MNVAAPGVDVKLFIQIVLRHELGGEEVKSQELNKMPDLASRTVIG